MHARRVYITCMFHEKPCGKSWWLTTLYTVWECVMCVPLSNQIVMSAQPRIYIQHSQLLHSALTNVERPQPTNEIYHRRPIIIDVWYRGCYYYFHITQLNGICFIGGVALSNRFKNTHKHIRFVFTRRKNWFLFCPSFSVCVMSLLLHLHFIHWNNEWIRYFPTRSICYVCYKWIIFIQSFIVVTNF